MNKKNLIFIPLLIFICSFISFMYARLSYIEKYEKLKGYYEISEVFSKKEAVRVNIYENNEIEIYKDNFNDIYKSKLKKYDKNVYTFKNNNENRVNVIFFKKGKMYLIFNKSGDIFTLKKIPETPQAIK